MIKEVKKALVLGVSGWLLVMLSIWHMIGVNPEGPDSFFEMLWVMTALVAGIGLIVWAVAILMIRWLDSL